MHDVIRWLIGRERGWRRGKGVCGRNGASPMPWRPIRRVPWPSRSPTRARKILPFLLFLIKKVINYTFRSVPMSFLHFAFVFRAREGAHA